MAVAPGERWDVFRGHSVAEDVRRGADHRGGVEAGANRAFRVLGHEQAEELLSGGHFALRGLDAHRAVVVLEVGGVGARAEVAPA